MMLCIENRQSHHSMFIPMLNTIVTFKINVIGQSLLVIILSQISFSLPKHYVMVVDQIKKCEMRSINNTMFATIFLTLNILLFVIWNQLTQ